MTQSEREEKRRDFGWRALECLLENLHTISSEPRNGQCGLLWEQLHSKQDNSNLKYNGFAVGTVLQKEWHGQCYELTVTATGFQYGELQFKTLSGAANHITGGQRNGKEFFGVNHGN